MTKQNPKKPAAAELAAQQERADQAEKFLAAMRHKREQLGYANAAWHPILRASQLYVSEIAIALDGAPESEACQLCAEICRILFDWKEKYGSASEDPASETEEERVEGIKGKFPWACLSSSIKTPIGLFMSLSELGYEPVHEFVGTSNEKFYRTAAVLIALSDAYVMDAAEDASADYSVLAGEVIEAALQLSVICINELKPLATKGASFTGKGVAAAKLRGEQKRQYVQDAADRCKTDGINEPSAKEIFDRLDAAGRATIPNEKAIYRLRESTQKNKPQ